MSKIIREKDAATYVGMSCSFLRKARCEGQIGKRTPGPPFFKIGRSVNYSTADLDAWLEQHRREI